MCNIAPTISIKTGEYPIIHLTSKSRCCYFCYCFGSPNNQLSYLEYDLELPRLLRGIDNARLSQDLKDKSYAPHSNNTIPVGTTPAQDHNQWIVSVMMVEAQ